MKNKIYLLFFLLFNFHANAQLHSSYSHKGVGYNAGGKNPYEVYMYLYNNRTFVIKSKSFGISGSEIVRVDSTSSKGTWSLRHDTLLLDFVPDTAYRNKEYDRYLVRKNKLIRITFDERVKYKALGKILKDD